MKRILIKNAHILPEKNTELLLEGSIIIEGTKIKQILWKKEQIIKNEQSFDEVFDAKGMIILPGMVNSHYHSYSNLLKGTINNLPLEPWSLYTVAYGHSFHEEDIRLSVLLGALEMIRHGVTSCLDHFPHTKHVLSALKAYEQSGMRVSFAPMLQDIRDDQFFNVDMTEYSVELTREQNDDCFETLYEQLVQNWHNKHGRIQICIGPNAPQRCSESVLTLCQKLSDRYDLNIHMHLLETYSQQQRIKEIYSKGVVPLLNRLGLLSSKLSVAHAVWLDELEIELLRDNEVSIVHNPASNLILGSGIAPIDTYLEKGMNVALGTDASNCGSVHNLFETMRLTAMIHRPGNLSYSKWIDETDVFNMATRAGATVLGLDNKIGKIELDYEADIVLLKTSNTTWSPINNPLSQLVFQENGSSVDSVMINGEWVMKAGEILIFNEHDLLLQVKERQQKLMHQSMEKLKIAQSQEPYVIEEWRRQNHVGI